MTKNEYNVAVIGSGPGGYVAAIRASQLGLKTACIEKDKTLGGTCLNVGCIPSKALLQSTEYYEFLINERLEHGIDCKDISANFKQMMERKSKVVSGLVNGIDGLFKKNKIVRIEGKASFLDAQTIEVSNGNEVKKITADYFIIATGSEPITLPFLPFDEKIIVSSTGALSLTQIPKKMIVIGGGVIGVEIASVYRRLGSEVAIVEMLDHICPAMDLSVSKSLLQILKKQGLHFYLSSKVSNAKKESNGVKIDIGEGETAQSLTGDVILVAVGRRPFTSGLNLEKAGIRPNSKGFLEIDSRFRTSQQHIFAIGDIVDGPMLAHRASEEGVAVAEIIAGQNPRINYAAIPNIIYTHPEVAALGLTEKEAKDADIDILIGTSYFRGNPRARCSGYTEGFVKIIGDKASSRLVGMHIIGAHASEMIGEGVLAIEKRATLEQLGSYSHAHPTLCEAIKEAALDALGKAIH